ncbi:hypothetical protein ABW21_db0208647 [Orbilia brochopaga]|nr:hypothetical protein ABW21_db0208647 [Drechslerella brochopaga]
MARQRGGARPSARPAPRPAAQQQQTRPASTAAMPAQAQPHAAQPPAAAAQGQTQSPGLFGQMASTAAGVAVGSTVGHVLGAGLTGMFGGSSSGTEAAQAPTAAAAPTTNTYGDVTRGSCEADAKAFTSCLEATNNDMSACNYYLDQLKACQAMFKQYSQQ